MTSRPQPPAARQSVLVGAEAGFSAAVTLAFRASNWIRNTQRSAETLWRGESKGKGRPDIKRGILPGPQRRQPAGAEGTPERGCPSGGGRGRRSAQGPSSLPPPMTCLGLGLGHHPIPRVGSGWHSGPAAGGCGFFEGGFGKAQESATLAPGFPPAFWEMQRVLPGL